MIFVTKCLSSPSSSYLPPCSFLPPSTLQLFPSCPYSLLILLSSLLSFLYFIHLSFPPPLFLIAALQSFFFPIHPYIHLFIPLLLHPSLPPSLPPSFPPHRFPSLLPSLLPPLLLSSLRSFPFILLQLLYSAKFLRRIIFTVFADSSHTTKIKFFKTFQLNNSRLCGMIWKHNNSDSTFAPLHGRQQQLYCYFKANASRFLGSPS